MFRKNSLVRRKRQILSFQILIIVRITFPLTCQSMGCRTRVRGNVQNQIARQSTIILLFVFQQISFVPIRFSLVFVGFFITSKLSHRAQSTENYFIFKHV